MIVFLGSPLIREWFASVSSAIMCTLSTAQGLGANGSGDSLSTSSSSPENTKNKMNPGTTSMCGSVPEVQTSHEKTQGFLPFAHGATIAHQLMPCSLDNCRQGPPQYWSETGSYVSPTWNTFWTIRERYSFRKKIYLQSDVLLSISGLQFWLNSAARGKCWNPRKWNVLLVMTAV